MNIIGRNFTVKNARYAKNMCAVCFSGNGTIWASYEELLAKHVTERYSGREKSYIMSKSQVKKFVALYGAWKAERRARNAHLF